MRTEKSLSKNGPLVTLDHCVIHATDWERSNAFYTKVMGAELIARPVGNIPPRRGL